MEYNSKDNSEAHYVLEKLGVSYKAVRKGNATFDTSELVDKLNLNPPDSSIIRKFVLFWKEPTWVTNRRVYHFGNHDGLIFEPIGNDRYILRFEDHTKASRKYPKQKRLCSTKE